MSRHERLPTSPRSTRPSSPVDGMSTGNDTSSPVTPLTPSLLFASLASPVASSEPSLGLLAADSDGSLGTSAAAASPRVPVASIRVIPPSPAPTRTTLPARPSSPGSSSRSGRRNTLATDAPFGSSYPPRSASVHCQRPSAAVAQRVCVPPPVASALPESASVLLATAPSSSLPKLEDPVIPLPIFTSEAHPPPRPRRWATEDPAQPGLHPVADYLYSSSLLASSLIHSTVPHNLGLVRRASSTGHLPLLLVPSRFTSIPTTPISKEAWLAAQGKLPLPASDSEANGHASDTGSVRTARSQCSRHSSNARRPSTLGVPRRSSNASKKVLTPSARLKTTRSRRPVSPGANSAGPYSADDGRQWPQEPESDSSDDGITDRDTRASLGYATFAPPWLVDDEALGASDRSSPDNGLGADKDWSAGPSPMVLGPAAATKRSDRVSFGGTLRAWDPEADSLEVESEGESAPLLGGRPPFRPRRSGPPPPHRLLLLVFLMAGAAATIVLIVFLVYASTHPLASFKMRVQGTQFLWTNPQDSVPSAIMMAAMRRRKTPKSAPVLDGFQLSINVSGVNKNYMSDIVLRQDQPLSVVLVEWRGPLVASGPSSMSPLPTVDQTDQPPFSCDSIPIMSRSSLGIVSLHKHKHQFTFPPGASTKWTVAANVHHPRSDDVDLDDKDPVWHRYRTNAQPGYTYYLAIHGEYAYTQVWTVERQVPVCVIHPLPPAPEIAPTQ